MAVPVRWARAVLALSLLGALAFPPWGRADPGERRLADDFSSAGPPGTG